MMRSIFAGYMVAGIALFACPPTPVPPDASDAAPPPIRDAAPLDASATVYQRACSNLASLGCQEGVSDNCAVVLEHVQVARLTDVHLDCLAAAKTKAAARACGSVSCP